MTWCLTSLRPGFQDLNPSLTKKFPPAGIWKSIRDNSVDRIKITNSEKVGFIELGVVQYQKTLFGPLEHHGADTPIDGAAVCDACGAVRAPAGDEALVHIVPGEEILGAAAYKTAVFPIQLPAGEQQLSLAAVGKDLGDIQGVGGPL